MMFSICIPQYNRTSFLLKALDSYSKQIFRDFEVCISDDCSTDGRTDELLDYLQRSGMSFRYCQPDKNGRYDKNIRSSMNLARGRYCLSHGVTRRLVHRLGLAKWFEPTLHRWFSRWAARSLKSNKSDVIHSFSGVSEELFLESSGFRKINTLVRGSPHIRTQARLLAEEQARCGHRVNQPSDWMIQQEIREDELAEIVFVLSNFAMNSFIQEGFPAEKLRLLPLGSELRRFRSDPTVMEQRCQRILSGKPLQVLTVGSFSLQKGAFDFTEIVERLNGRVKFRFVGDLPAETRHLRNQIKATPNFWRGSPSFPCQSSMLV